VKNLTPPPGNLFPERRGAALLLDDSRNSSLASTRAAAEILASFPGRKIFFLDEVAELGKSAEELHRALGKELAEILASTGAEIFLLAKNLDTALGKGLTTGDFPERKLHRGNPMTGAAFARKILAGKEKALLLFEGREAGKVLASFKE